MLQIKKTFYFEIIKCILDENQLLQAAQKKSFVLDFLNLQMTSNQTLNIFIHKVC